jgi:hypothetical protein
MPEITAVYINADRSQLVIELDNGDNDLLLFSSHMENEDAVTSITAMEGSHWIPLVDGN